MKLVTKTDVSKFEFNKNDFKVINGSRLDEIYEYISVLNEEHPDSGYRVEYKGLGRVEDGIQSYPVVLYAIGKDSSLKLVVVKNMI